MSSTLENKILNLQERLRAENESRDRDRQGGEVGPTAGLQSSSSSSSTGPASSPALRRPRQRKHRARKVPRTSLDRFPRRSISWRQLRRRARSRSTVHSRVLGYVDHRDLVPLRELTIRRTASLGSYRPIKYDFLSVCLSVNFLDRLSICFGFICRRDCIVPLFARFRQTAKNTL